MDNRIPVKGLKKNNIEYSFRFHSYDNMNDEDKYSERWWLGERNGTAWTMNKNDINIDILDAIDEAKKADISFDTMFSHCISHEIIHNVLMRYESIFLSRVFDRICYGKNKNFKQWFGGMA